jgi:NADPH-dependent curcumin reductase CurA
MAQQQNTRVIFKSQPQGWVKESDMAVERGPVPESAEGQVLVRNLFMSLDPYMRGRMTGRKSYIQGFQLGEALQAGVVGRIAKSRNPKFAEGDHVFGMLGWEEWSLSDGKGLRKVDPSVGPLSWHLGVLGMPGMTAWVGLNLIGEPKAGETIYVSAASGAVGQLVGQLAKLKALHVAGSAGDDAKVAYLKEIGYDAAFNYKSAGPLREALQAACPKGIDIYFENVGGEMLDAVLGHINVRARIVACGMISQYNATEPYGVKNLMQLVVNRAKIQGFIVSDHADRFKEFAAEVTALLKSGRLKYREHVTRGIENAPKAFIGMLKGENFGKAVVQIADA